MDEFRDPTTAERLIAEIDNLGGAVARCIDRPLRVMEFCGGHTHTVFKYGIEQRLPDWIELVHGPGCPVCVLPRSSIDTCIALAQRPGVTIATFGDAMRVPGSKQSLISARAAGADIRMVYSPLDALELAKNNPEREVVFFALGFETTMPSTALTVLDASHRQIMNFSLYCNHTSTLPTLRGILDDADVGVDAYIAPGHVAMVLGEQPFEFVAKDYNRPIVITGFEPLDLLQSILMLVKQIARGGAKLENQYTRVVTSAGNLTGRRAIHQVYHLNDDACVKMNASYRAWDAVDKFKLSSTGTDFLHDEERCNTVLKGAIAPWQCPEFGTGCTPHKPLGALMVSSEGACAAYYRFKDVGALISQRIALQNQEASSE